MKPPAAVLAAILLSAGAGPATTGAASLPDEAIKIRALRLAYSLNADSMVRAGSLGSIDVSGLLFVPDSSLIERPPVAIREAPLAKPPISPTPDMTPKAPAARSPRPPE